MATQTPGSGLAIVRAVSISARPNPNPWLTSHGAGARPLQDCKEERHRKESLSDFGTKRTYCAGRAAAPKQPLVLQAISASLALAPPPTLPALIRIPDVQFSITKPEVTIDGSVWLGVVKGQVEGLTSVPQVGIVILCHKGQEEEKELNKFNAPPVSWGDSRTLCLWSQVLRGVASSLCRCQAAAQVSEAVHDGFLHSFPFGAPPVLGGSWAGILRLDRGDVFLLCDDGIQSHGRLLGYRDFQGDGSFLIDILMLHDGFFLYDDHSWIHGHSICQGPSFSDGLILC